MQGKVYDMFYGAPPIIHRQARELRRRETKAEKILWNFLSNHKLKVKFRRQHPISQFIADFYCHEIKLVIEVDGGIHHSEEHQEYDRMRDDHLQKFGINLLRFTNKEVLINTEKVLDSIILNIERIKTIRK
jgi:very-short-patch-repair endonuclease